MRGYVHYFDPPVTTRHLGLVWQGRLPRKMKKAIKKIFIEQRCLAVGERYLATKAMRRGKWIADRSHAGKINDHHFIILGEDKWPVTKVTRISVICVSVGPK